MRDPIIQTSPLGSRWQTEDPFLFCVHHIDHYPLGNSRMGPDAPLAGHDIGQDFEGKEGWRMYHGDVVPGFPQHPHRGFETVTIVRTGYIDHSDSLGATARFGMGDVQWLTAGAGVVHSEMFPLLHADRPNDLELFQIWLNLPGRDKLVAPYFTMLWDQDIPRAVHRDAAGRTATITVIAGALDGLRAAGAAAQLVGARPEADVAIWSIALDAGASWLVPPARDAATARTLPVHGTALQVGDRLVQGPAAIRVHADQPVPITAPTVRRNSAAAGPSHRRAGRAVGPFVMNTRAELEQAFQDYRQTQFGGWPFPENAPVHPRDRGRFAHHADGRVEEAGA
jgi:redox-sensitive bicupin YhaK (pirin superfamily)